MHVVGSSIMMNQIQKLPLEKGIFLINFDAEQALNRRGKKRENWAFISEIQFLRVCQCLVKVPHNEVIYSGCDHDQNYEIGIENKNGHDHRNEIETQVQQVTEGQIHDIIHYVDVV